MNAVNLYTTENLIERVAKLVCEASGQDDNEKLRARIEIKLRRRLLELGLQSFTEYATFFQLHEKSEFKHVLASLTIQSTRFFSEFSHFEYISTVVLKTLIPELRRRPDKTLHVWSTACSRGQEAYSLAMYLKQALTLYGTDLQVKVAGTDSELDAIKLAQTGAFPCGEMRDVPLQFLGNDWQRITISGHDLMRAKPSLKRMVHFEYANLLGLKAKFPGQKFDLIFARNVFSYFNESEIKESCQELLNRLHRSGHLFVGITESLLGLGLPIQLSGPSVYTLQESAEKTSNLSSPKSPDRFDNPPEAEPIKVFCIDDSPAVHTLMRSILKKENGFLIVANADSLSDAQRQSKVLQDADLVTVNLQASEESSFQYLEKNLKEFHPPALIVCSELKEQGKLTEVSSRFGEFDFFEKPVLNHLSEQGEVIRAKLRTLFLSRRNNVLAFRGQDQFKNCSPIASPAEKVRILIGGISHLRKISNYLRELKGDQPPTYLFFESISANLGQVATELKRLSGKNCVHGKEISEGLKVNEIGLYDFRTFFPKIAGFHKGQKTSIGVLGDIGKNTSELILTWPDARLILEDLGNGEASDFLKSRVQDIFPASSFAYLSSEHLQD